MPALAQRVLAFVRKYDMIRAGDRVGVAVSGGADSVALLRLLLELRAELGIVLSVVHFNHKIRGEAADSDEHFVRELAATHGLDLHISSADTPAHAKQKKLSLEAAARELRYSYFESLMRSGLLNKVATAHTLDDQAETVLLRIIRGTGTAGLSGIAPKIEHTQQDSEPWGSVVRPLLGSKRNEIELYLRETRQLWREDATNADVKFTRNRVRHTLLPLLEREFNPAVRDRLAELAEIARDEEAFWQNEVTRSFAEATIGAGAAPLSPRDRVRREHHLAANKLLQLPRALQRRLIRECAEQIGLHLDFKHVQDVLWIASAGTNAHLDLPGGGTAEDRVIWEPGSAPSRAGAALILRGPTLPAASAASEFPYSPLATDHSGDYSCPLPIPGEVLIPELNSVISARLIPLRGADRLKAENISGEPASAGYNPNQLLDPQKLASELTVRNWRPGDRFWPAHTATPKKIKELLQQRHITGAARHLWPVIISGPEIVWLKDFPVRQEYGIRDDSEVALLIEVRPL